MHEAKETGTRTCANPKCKKPFAAKRDRQRYCCLQCVYDTNKRRSWGFSGGLRTPGSKT